MSITQFPDFQNKYYHRSNYCPFFTWRNSPRDLSRSSAAACSLGLWVRILPGAWRFVCCECCLMSGRGLCDELITRPEESYRLWCVVVCDTETSWMRRPWPTGGSRAKNKQTAIRPLIIKASRSHSDTPQSVGLLRTRDRSDAETSTWQHTTLTTDKPPQPLRDSNQQSQQARGYRPTP
jgi:hypothetical protein